jgi:hypothetical protein
MATLSTAERNAVIDAVLVISGEDYQTAARALRLLQGSLSAIPWATILASRAAIYAPFISSGLSINWWVAEVLRLAA